MAEIFIVLIIIIIIILVALILWIRKMKFFRMDMQKQRKSGGSMTHELSFINPDQSKLTYDIIAGRKTVEGRKDTPQYQKIHQGDILVLNEKDVKITCDVTYVNKYDSVSEYIKSEGIHNALPVCFIGTR